MRVVARSLALLALVVLMPAALFAQAVIAGSVKDSSGAVLPGVTVEAASPALIEKVRTAVTDGTGQYRIEDLRPGTYTVTFTLQGFSTFKREGIELTGSFTATDQRRAQGRQLSPRRSPSPARRPIVDVQSARREMTLNNDVLKAIPTVRNYNAMVVLVPGVVTNLNDVVTGTATTQFPIHGGRNNEGRLHDRRAQHREPAGRQSAAGLHRRRRATRRKSPSPRRAVWARRRPPGLVMNIVPKTGGNAVSGSIVLQRHRREAAVGQLHRRRCKDAGLDGGDAAHQGLRPQRRRSAARSRRIASGTS